MSLSPIDLHEAFSDKKTVREIACELCNIALSVLKNQFGNDRIDVCAIFGFFDFDRTKILKLKGAAGYQPERVRWKKINIGQGLVGRVALNKKYSFSSDEKDLSLLGIEMPQPLKPIGEHIDLLACPAILSSGQVAAIFVVGKLNSDEETQSYFRSAEFLDTISQVAKQIAIIHNHAVTIAKAVRSKKYTTNERHLTAAIKQFYRTTVHDFDTKKFIDHIAPLLMRILNAGNSITPYYRNYLYYEYQTFRGRYVLRSYIRKPQYHVPTFSLHSRVYKKYIEDGLVKSVESQKLYVEGRGKEPHIVRHIKNKVEEIVEMLDADWSPCGDGAAFLIPLFEDKRPLGLLVFLSAHQIRQYVKNPPFHLGEERRQVSVYDLKVFRSLQPFIANEYYKLRVDEERQRGIADLENILGAMKEIILLEDRREVLNRLAKFTIQSLNCEGCFIYLIDRQKNTLEIAAASGFQKNSDELKKHLVFPMDSSEPSHRYLPVHIAASRRDFMANGSKEFRSLCGNHKKFGSLFSELKSERVISYVGMPIGDIGVIEVFNKCKPSPTNWSFFEDQDRTTLQHICEAIATVLTRMEATIEQVQQEKTKATDELLLDISHELRNPLYTSRIFLHNLRESLNGQSSFAEDSGALQKLEIVERNVAKAQRILRSMQGFQQVMLHNNEDVVDLEKIICMVLETNRSLSEQQGITLSSEFKAEAPYVLGDETLLNQVFTNLVTNAMDAMPNGGKLTARLYEQDNQVHAEIEDDGTGIPDDIKYKVFEPFVTTKNSDKGTGLGLNLCRRIIKQYSGEIDFDSEVGRGTKFFVTLPKHVESVKLESVKQSTIQAQHKERVAPAIAEFAWSEPPQAK